MPSSVSVDDKVEDEDTSDPVKVKIELPSTKFKLKFKRRVHYFFRVWGQVGGWCRRMENKATSAFN